MKKVTNMFAPVIKWSGSKRTQAKEILKNIPGSFNMYYEPFIGGGSILYALSPEKAICEEYRFRWNRLQSEGYTAYYEIRDNFNKSKSPEDLLFLSRTCVNGLIRFNANGDFNNSLHHTRPGIHPDTLTSIIYDWAEHIKGATFFVDDYKKTTENAKSGDFIYLDPPYFHTVGRYYGISSINFDEFIEYLDDLNQRGINYMLSFDGKRGETDYTVELPHKLYKRHIFIASGNSSFKKVIDKESQLVYESLYMNY